MDEELIQITPNALLFNNSLLRGLCGNYDHDGLNDLQGRNGAILDNEKDFVIANTLSTTISVELNVNEENIRKNDGTKICQIIDSFPNSQMIGGSKFARKKCDVAVGSKTGNDAVELGCNYVKYFAFELISHSIDIPDWRKNNICAPECPAGMVYSDCESPCPNFCGSGESEEITCDFTCVPGCFCPKGKRFEGGKCIDKEQCSCEYNGKKYASGSKVNMDCNSCKWTCETKKCPVTCSLIGRNTFTTFDTLVYTMEPVSCGYTLVQSKEKSNNLKISMEFESCTSPFQTDLSCFNNLIVESYHYVIKINPTGFYVNNIYKNDSIFHGKGIVIKKITNFYYSVEGEKFAVAYEPGKALYIRLDSDYKGKVLGLCGNYDLDKTNDFTGFNGLELHKTKFVTEFRSASCSKTQTSELKVDPCSVNTANLETATKFCSIMEESKIFSECLNVVPPNMYKEFCMRDMCSSNTYSKESFCTALEAYSKKCGENGIDINWLSNTTLRSACSKTCPIGTNQVYTTCKLSCETSCHDLNRDLSDCTSTCISGCQCPNGTLMDNNGVCVPKSNCTCYDKHHRKHYQSGEVVQILGRECKCSSGVWGCSALQEQVVCPKNQQWIGNATNCQETCHTLSKPEKCQLYEEEYEGCRCGSGQVLSPNGTCILPSDCPCEYGGKWLPANSQLIVGCKTL
ncbi:mucin-2-like [Argonauta hians]